MLMGGFFSWKLALQICSGIMSSMADTDNHSVDRGSIEPGIRTYMKRWAIVSKVFLFICVTSILFQFGWVLWELLWSSVKPEHLNDPLLAQRALYGDSFGFITAFFTALAFIVLVATLYYQRKELELQRMEMKANNETQKAQADEFEKQVEMMRRQQFDSHFFQLLNSWFDMRNSIRVIRSTLHLGTSGGSIISEGIDGIHVLSEDLKTHLYGSINPNTFEAMFMNFYRINRKHLWNYFLLLRELLSYVIESKHVGYINIIKAHLTQSEMELLACKAATDERFKYFVDKHGLLDNIDFSQEHVKTALSYCITDWKNRRMTFTPF